MRKVLFVCSANLDRSPRAQKLFNNWKGKWEARSAGITASSEGTALTQAVIDWAELVLVMEPAHAQFLHDHFKCDPNKVRVLNIRTHPGDSKLIKELMRKVPPILEMDDPTSHITGKIDARKLKGIGGRYD